MVLAVRNKVRFSMTAPIFNFTHKLLWTVLWMHIEDLQMAKINLKPPILCVLLFMCHVKWLNIIVVEN